MNESQRHVKVSFGFTSKQMAILEGSPGDDQRSSVAFFLVIPLNI